MSTQSGENAVDRTFVLGIEKTWGKVCKQHIFDSPPLHFRRIILVGCELFFNIETRGVNVKV